MKLYDLRTEYRVNPIGITEKHPRFSWKLESGERDTIQQSYHIVVTADEKIVWETKAESEESVLIPYAGEELRDETLYQVSVAATDNHGNTAAGEMSFETGILEPETFQAKMITHDFPEDEIMVGNGWYKGIFGFMLTPNIYGDRVGAFAEIHLEYEDGSREAICTDESWNARTGAVRYSEIYMGETIDTTISEAQDREQSGIRTGSVSVIEFDKSTLTAQENESVRITERVLAKKLIVTPKGEKLVDFGQNLTGLVELKVHGRKGQKIVIHHAEVLDKDGNFYPDTLRQAKSEDTYICNGEEQVFLPHFTFHGFRYISVEGMDDMRLDQFTACVMHSDMEKSGDFQCSNPKVNQLQ